jgi:nitrite reductase (NAD(P)H)
MIDVPPSQFILGAGGKQDESGADLDDDTQICSCHVRRCFGRSTMRG